jgi:hypothetical protein
MFAGWKPSGKFPIRRLAMEYTFTRNNMGKIAVVLVVAVMVSIGVAGSVPDKTWKPATISLTYAVSVPKDVPFKITRTWGDDTQSYYCVHDYLAVHRASFLECVREYVQGKSEPKAIDDYPIDERAVVAGHKLAQEQLEKLEKELGKEKLIQQLKDEGYGEEAGK